MAAWVPDNRRQVTCAPARRHGNAMRLWDGGPGAVHAGTAEVELGV